MEEESRSRKEEDRGHGKIQDWSPDPSPDRKDTDPPRGRRMRKAVRKTRKAVRKMRKAVRKMRKDGRKIWKDGRKKRKEET